MKNLTALKGKLINFVIYIECNNIINFLHYGSEVLLYHVVPDVAYSLSLKNGQTYKTAQGQTVKITINGKIKKINH